MPPVPAVIFDLDGTLVDSAPDIHAAINRLLARDGRDGLDLAQVREFVGEGPEALIERAFAATGAAVAADRVPALVDAFIAFYRRHPADHTRLFDGVRPMLDRLADCRLGVCTNKPDAMIAPVLDTLGLTRYFTAMVGGDFARRKPDGEHLRETLRRMDALGHPALMVGDSPADVTAARDAGLPVVVVGFGYSRVPVGTLGADRVIDDFAELPAVVKALLG